MFRRCGASAVVAMLLAAGCGGERTSSPPITEPGASATTPSSVPSTTAAVGVTTTESTVPASTEPAPTSTPTTNPVALQPVAELPVLRPDGLSSVDFGTPADEAVERLSALLGPPDLVEGIAPIGEGCVEGAGWLDCLRDLRVVDEGRLAVWATYGLEVAMVDTSRDEVAAAEADLEIAQVELSRCNIKSPIAGTISQRYVASGEYVREGTELYDIVATQRVKVAFSLAERGGWRIPILRSRPKFSKRCTSGPSIPCSATRRRRSTWLS